MPKITRKCRKRKKKEIRLDKSRFDWDTNAPPWEERKKIHPVKRPKIPDFCTSHHHNLDLIETFLFSWVTTNNNNAKKWKRKSCVFWFISDQFHLCFNNFHAKRAKYDQSIQDILGRGFPELRIVFFFRPECTRVCQLFVSPWMIFEISLLNLSSASKSQFKE